MIWKPRDPSIWHLLIDDLLSSPFLAFTFSSHFNVDFNYCGRIYKFPLKILSWGPCGTSLLQSKGSNRRWRLMSSQVGRVLSALPPSILPSSRPFYFSPSFPSSPAISLFPCLSLFPLTCNHIRDAILMIWGQIWNLHNLYQFKQENISEWSY